MPSIGNLKILVVFARFKDDNSIHPYWPAGGNPTNPGYTTWIDPNMQTGSTNVENFTHYFKDMSLGVFNVTGTAVSVETPYPMAHYGTAPNMDRHLATMEVLQQKVDPLVNFADFDNWTYNSNYHHINQPDNSVDMIVMIWRVSGHPFPFFDPYLGEASLGGGTAYTVEGGTKTINTGYLGSNSPGSGVTNYYWGERGPKYSFHGMVHEIGHWLLGSPHPYSQGGNDHHYIWGLMTGPGYGICANTFERERLAWINPNNITGDIINAPLNDYVSTGVVYKYHPSNGATNEYFYFENHQKLNIEYDDATINPNDKGIFVIHQQAAYNSSNNIRCKTSNGQFDWESPSINSCFGGINNVRSFKTTTINRSGRNNRDELLFTGGSSQLFSLINMDGQAICGGYLHGDQVNNSFNTTFNNVFSNYSNPWARRWTNDATNNFTMEITTQNGSVVNARFYLTNPLDGKPSKPQNLRVSSSATYHPLLTWDANIEPVGNIVNYKLYKKTTYEGGFQYLATVTGTSYEDVTESYCPPGQYCQSGHNIYYKVTAIDNQSKESIPSDSIKTHVLGGAPDKIVVNPQTDVIPTEYKLGQNYPNPFNPKTIIGYQLPKNGLVQLKVYDLLGSEVAVLVNEVQSEGVYTVNFDASNLPSGVYVYSLRVNEFVQNNKMTLLK